MHPREEANKYINGDDDKETIPSERHMSLLNFLIGYNLESVLHAIEWHEKTYPDEKLHTF